MFLLLLLLLVVIRLSKVALFAPVHILTLLPTDAFLYIFTHLLCHCLALVDHLVGANLKYKIIIHIYLHTHLIYISFKSLGLKKIKILE